MTASPRSGPTFDFASLLASPELRTPYRAVVAVLLLAGLGLLGIGITGVAEWRGAAGVGGLTTGILGLGGGALVLVLALAVRRFRLFMLTRSASPLSIAVDLDALEEEDFEALDRAQRLREEKARRDFDRNLRAEIKVERVEGRHLTLFPSAEWDLQPGVNILLGRNGYGKSLLLKAVVGALQRDDAATQPLLSAGDRSEPLLELTLRRDGVLERIRRDADRFSDSIGKIPVLAIPDSRFFDRSRSVVGPPDEDAMDLRSGGALHFLRQEPYWDVIQGLLYEISLDYWEHGRSFDRPVFVFLQECVERLTGYEFTFHSIERRGPTGFEIRVVTEGNPTPIPIRYASQGTLSILAVFGLIRSYLRMLGGGRDDDETLRRSAIIAIDEADAHLHPTWQQRVPTLLRDFFPNVQFILSAHSPLFVAGCWSGEVAVLRRVDASSSAGFTIEQLDRDFVGASAAELYDRIFEIEELDATYLEYATKATMRDRYSDRINELTMEREKRGTLPPDEEAELRWLTEESRRIRFAMDVKERRAEEDRKDLRIAELESELSRVRLARTDEPPLTS